MSDWKGSGNEAVMFYEGREPAEQWARVEKLAALLRRAFEAGVREGRRTGEAGAMERIRELTESHGALLAATEDERARSQEERERLMRVTRRAQTTAQKWCEAARKYGAPYPPPWWATCPACDGADGADCGCPTELPGPGEAEKGQAGDDIRAKLAYRMARAMPGAHTDPGWSAGTYRLLREAFDEGVFDTPGLIDSTGGGPALAYDSPGATEGSGT